MVKTGNNMEQKKTSLELKDFEIILWLLPGVFILLNIIHSYGLDFLFKNPASLVDIIFAFSPLLFAIFFSLIYENFPIYHIISLLKKERKESD
jgi:hypothetical protein